VKKHIVPIVILTNGKYCDKKCGQLQNSAQLPDPYFCHIWYSALQYDSKHKMPYPPYNNPNYVLRCKTCEEYTEAKEK